MKTRLLTGGPVTVLVMVLAVLTSYAFAGSELYTMEGKISAVEPEHDTVVVEVPVGKVKMFTVGGPLVADAVLEKYGRSADLEDFSSGDFVAVSWRSTPNGHVIERLVEKPR